MAIIDTTSKNTPKYDATVAKGMEPLDGFERTAVFADALAGNSMVFAVAWLLASG